VRISIRDLSVRFTDLYSQLIFYIVLPIIANLFNIYLTFFFTMRNANIPVNLQEIMNFAIILISQFFLKKEGRGYVISLLSHRNVLVKEAVLVLLIKNMYPYTTDFMNLILKWISISLHSDQYSNIAGFPR
jgi:hypothetical protein